MYRLRLSCSGSSGKWLRSTVKNCMQFLPMIWPPKWRLIPKDRSRTGAGNERTTKRSRNPEPAREVRTGVHRPDVPECVRACVAVRTRNGKVLPQSPWSSVRLFGADGSHDEELRGGHRAVCRTGADPGCAVPQGTAER